MSVTTHLENSSHVPPVSSLCWPPPCEQGHTAPHRLAVCVPMPNKPYTWADRLKQGITGAPEIISVPFLGRWCRMHADVREHHRWSLGSLPVWSWDVFAAEVML